MAFELNQTAVSGAGLLRAIAAGGWTSSADLAERAGRRPNHIARDLGVFEKAGLITRTPEIALTDDGRAQLDAIDRAEGQTTGDELLPDERLVVHAQLRPDPDNPRKDFQSDDAEEGLDELRQSILLRGRLLQNLVVRADPDGLADYIVTTGNRRWHAIQQAIWDGDWPEDRAIRVVVREGTAQEHLLTAVTENMIRRNMAPIEEAEAFGELVNIHGLKTLDISHETGLSQKVIQNRLKLLKLSDDDRDRMRLPDDHPDHLGYKAALRQLTVAKEPEKIAGTSRSTLVSDRDGPGNPHLIVLLIEAAKESERQDGVAWDRILHLEPNLQWPVGWEQWIAYTAATGAFELRSRALDWLIKIGLEKPDWLPLLTEAAEAAGYDTSCFGSEHYSAPLNDLREPGSPDPSPTPAEAPSLGKKLTDIEALILAEIVDKAEREPNDLHPDYTAALPSAMKSGVPQLIARGLLGTRQLGMTLLIRPLLHSSGLKEWLDDLGFNASRDDVLFELAARIEGAENVINRQQAGLRYATAWLNLEGDPRNDGSVDTVPGPSPEGRTLPQTKQNPTASEEAESGSIFEPEQPELIEATEEEKAARRRAERLSAEAASDEAALVTFTGWMRDKLAQKRAQGAQGWRNPTECTVQNLADLLVGHVGKGDPVNIAILAMMLGIRAGAMGAPGYLRAMPTPRMEQLMIEARTARTISPDGPEQPDPVEDFVQEELDEAEAEHPSSLDGAPTPVSPLEPAVPIRKSITADYIVCLEDGRKFKSMKRHLRVNYDLTPEQYIARWGLPRDYPMVAPNYAKARADLARQMGLRSE